MSEICFLKRTHVALNNTTGQLRGGIVEFTPDFRGRQAMYFNEYFCICVYIEGEFTDEEIEFHTAVILSNAGLHPNHCSNL